MKVEDLLQDAYVFTISIVALAMAMALLWSGRGDGLPQVIFTSVISYWLVHQGVVSGGKIATKASDGSTTASTNTGQDVTVKKET